MLFHLTTREAWERAQRDGRYEPPSLATEGFIHLSSATQWPATALRYYRGRTHLVLLTIDEARLEGEVRWEMAHGEAFPHLYSALASAAVRRVQGLAPDATGALHTVDPAG